MQRRQLAATVAAITMSVTSGVIAIGANTGTLGFAEPNPAAPAPVVAPGTPAPRGGTNPAPSREANQGNGSGEREGAPGGATTASARPGGEHDD